MKKTRRLSVIVASLIAVGWLCGPYSVGEEKAVPENSMKKKLEFSKNILDGLVGDDFETIVKNAKALNKLGEKRWQESDSPEYRTQVQVFWFASEALVTAAEEKNIDGATLSYTQMTLSCVNCHKLLRRK